MPKLAHIKTKKFEKSRNKHALVQEGPGYPRNSTTMGVSHSVLAHLVMKGTIQDKTRNIILSVSYDAVPPYGSYGG